MKFNCWNRDWNQFQQNEHLVSFELTWALRLQVPQLQCHRPASSTTRRSFFSLFPELSLLVLWATLRFEFFRNSFARTQAVPRLTAQASFVVLLCWRKRASILSLALLSTMPSLWTLGPRANTLRARFESVPETTCLSSLLKVTRLQIRFLADGNGDFARAVGMVLDLTSKGTKTLSSKLSTLQTLPYSCSHSKVSEFVQRDTHS